MMIGILIGRNGWMRRIPELMPWVKRLQWWAFGVGVLCALIFGILGELGVQRFNVASLHGDHVLRTPQSMRVWRG